ncbi:MAG: metallophosphoesterase family protein [Ruminococcus flavefaciens]|nr:metallophosphoesterase family protein [Ruminococcus flavefaciens]MCM1229488.1 metallophosphoesterase family protein [Ruminococcus flavefaciens]
MKILAVADEESRYLWDFYDKSKLADIDLILSAGDLKPEYLEFLVTMSRADVIYVNGNHDKKIPEGCICADGKLINYKGLRILGFGGSMRYSTGKNQYTEKEMSRRIRRCRLSILKNKGFDILLTHAPASGINDMADLPHKGFECFADLVEKYSPNYFIHGHIHKTYGNFVREQKIGGTTVINAFEKYTIEI